MEGNALILRSILPRRVRLYEHLGARSRFTFAFLVLLLIVGAMLFLYVWQFISMVEIQMDIARMRKECAALQERMEYERMRQAELSSLERIDKLARERLGMGPPEEGAVVYLEPTPGRLASSTFDSSGSRGERRCASSTAAAPALAESFAGRRRDVRLLMSADWFSSPPPSRIRRARGGGAR